MTDYTNPTGTFNATEGDDKILFTAFPFSTAVMDALGGNDRLVVQIDYDMALSFEAIDWSNAGGFSASVRSPYQLGVLVYKVENVEMRGTSADDDFKVQLGSNPFATSVVMDGAAGQDKLAIDWSKYAGGLSFIVDGSTISSSYGTFSNIEVFDITAGSGNDTITTGSGNDNIVTGMGVDVIRAGAGNDYIYSQSTGGSVDGGEGIDHYGASFGATNAALTVNIGSTITVSNGIVVTNVEGFGLGGGTGNDVFNVTTAMAGTVYGNSGSDTVAYSASAANTGIQVTVSAYLGTQLDGYIGPFGNGLSFQQFESVSVTGTQFGDQFSISGDYSGAGLNLNAGGGNDVLIMDLRGSSAGTSFSVSGTGVISSNRGSFSAFESFSFSGGTGADTFVAGSAADGLTGGRGADYLNGGAGDDGISAADSTFEDDGAADTLIGGVGNDIISAGYGDTVSGDSGTDELYYIGLSATAGITANFATLTSGGTITVGGATLSGIETVGGIYGSNFGDTLVVGKLTTSHDVQIFGWAGDDRITGSSAADTIYGGTGNDWLTGGLGKDNLFDSEGNDTFADTAAGLSGDTISGFYVGDKIIITDANLSTFTFSVSGNTLTYSGGSLTIGSQLAGPLQATAAVGGGVQLALREPPPGTVDLIADQLVSGYWDGDQRRFDVSQSGSISVNISGLNATEQNLARVALSEWSDIIGVSFQEVSTGGQILFENAEDPLGAYTQIHASGGLISSSIIRIPSSFMGNGTGLNSDIFYTYVHEIGHALGLGHAGNYNFEANYFADALYSNDSWATSVMSYFNQRESKYFDDLGFSIEYAMTPMQADILAMQALYGLSGSTRSGDTIYGFGSNAGRDVFNASLVSDGAYTIFDTGGVDTLNYSGFGMNMLINLNPETFSNVGYSSGNVSIARGTIIENAIGGSASDTIIGNAANNYLDGGWGMDAINGGAGNDRIIYDSFDQAWQVTGGSGTDTLVINDVAAPWAYNLVAGSFEQAERIEHDDGANNWSTITSTYNQSWQMTTYDIRHDDGTRGMSNFDVNNTENWAQVWFNYDQQGRIVTADLFRDDGAHNWAQYDVNNQQAWSELYFIFDGQNRVVSHDIRYDDGTRGWSNLDIDNTQSWSQAWFTYDAQGRVVSQETTNDDGTRVWGEIDAGGTQPWSASWYGFDTQNRMTSLEVRYDDNSRSWTGYDANGSQAWSSVAYLYDPTDHLYQQVTTWDDGSTTVLSV